MRMPAGVHAGEVEQVRREVREAVDLAPGRGEELAPRALVEILVGEQLEEAGQGEERRSQLVRGIGDELLAGPVELRQLDAHAVERARELADLVVAGVDDGLVERALGDPLGRLLEAPEPPRVERGDDEAERDRER